MKTATKRKETSALTIDRFIDDMKTSSTEPVRIECGITSDYSIFKRFPANRLLNEKRAEKIGQDMSRTGNFSTVDCVRQGNHLLVWDGQHVLAAAKISGKHVNYNVWDKIPKGILRMYLDVLKTSQRTLTMPLILSLLHHFSKFTTVVCMTIR